MCMQRILQPLEVCWKVDFVKPSFVFQHPCGHLQIVIITFSNSSFMTQLVPTDYFQLQWRTCWIWTGPQVYKFIPSKHCTRLELKTQFKDKKDIYQQFCSEMRPVWVDEAKPESRKTKVFAQAPQHMGPAWIRNLANIW